MKKIFSMAIILLSMASISYAEPTPAIKYLMNKPVSLFDWGVHHIDEHLKVMHITFYLDADELKLRTAQLKTTVGYDWADNRITINSNTDGVSFVMDEKEAAKKLCREIVKKIRVELMVDADNPSITPSSTFTVDNFFSHSGYKLQDEPERLAEELLTIIDISTSLRYWGKTDDMKGLAHQINCKTPLMSKEAYYSK